MSFMHALLTSIRTKNTHLCIGLDSRFDKIPEELKKNTSVSDAIFNFNKHIIVSTHDVAACYKMNVAFYAGFGAPGLDALQRTNKYISDHYRNIPRLADCKRSEMGDSVKLVKQEIFDWLGFDCIMVTPWFGFDTVRDYLHDPHYGVCVYVHDSNPSAGEFQDLELKDGRRVYEVVADRVQRVWNTKGNIFVEAAATYPKELCRVREIVGEDMIMLVAGVGAQGGSIDTLKGLFGVGGKRLVVNSSRDIIFAGIGKKDYFEAVRIAAKTLRDKLRILSSSVNTFDKS